MNKDTSSKLWGEKIEAGEEFDDVKVICRPWGDELILKAKATQLEGYSKRYWSKWNAIFNEDNSIILVITIGIVVVAFMVGILFFGGFFPSDIGY